MTAEEVSNDLRFVSASSPQQRRRRIGVFQQELIYTNVVFITFFHLLALYFALTAPYVQHWHITIFHYVVGTMGGLGVTAAAHRYYSHRSFKAKPPLVILFLILYAMAGHNKLYDWVRDHRVHHRFSETDADPHNSRRGFFFAHVGWLMMRKHPDVHEKGKSVDMSDIARDPLVTWYDRHFVLMKAVFCFGLPTAVPPVAWGASWYYSCVGTVVRYILSLNFTWLVNSAAHLYGYKPYDRRIGSAENLTVSLLSYGEGWHNYHHTFPWDYRASELGKLNLTTHFLHLMAKIGWCYDLRCPSEELVRKVAAKYGDGTYANGGGGGGDFVVDEELAEDVFRMSSHTK